MSKYEFPARVSYPDIDRQMQLSAAGALRLMQEAAIVHADQLGCCFRQVEKTHFLWMLVGWHLRMEEPACWNDALTVKTWPRSLERVTSRRCFAIVKEDGTPVAKADSTWILVNADTHRAMRVTPEVAAMLPLTEEDVFEAPFEPGALAEGELTYEGEVLRRDLDTNDHVNNLIYLDYARQALPEALCACRIRELTVGYKRQLLLGDRFHCRYRKGEGCHKVEIYSEDETVLHCEVTLVLEE